MLILRMGHRIRRCGGLRRQIALQQNSRRDPVDHAFAFLPADICGDEQIFRRFRGHPFVPQDDRHGQPRFQFHHKRAHGLNGKPFTPVQLKRQS